jgi:hypothetical protein
MREAAALAFLAIAAGQLFFPHARVIGPGADSWQMLAAMHTTGVPSLPSTWFGGRPFLGLSWNLAAQIGGGSIAGFNYFQYAALLASSLLVYLFVRLLTGAPFWAFAAAALKLAWPANPEVFDNSGLPIYFAEALFWLALVLWLGGVQGRIPRAAAAAAIPPALIVAIGTYQTTWPAVLLAPAAALFTHPRPSRRWLLWWHGWSAAAMAFSLWHLKQVPRVDMVLDPGILLGRAAKGIAAATAASYREPLLADGSALAIAFFLAAAAAAGLRPARLPPATALRIAAFSLIWIAATLIPPSVVHVPAYPSRVLHFAAFGSIALFLALAALLFRSRAGIAAGLALMAWMFAGSAKATGQAGVSMAANSVVSMRFWKQWTDLLPAVEEGTVIQLAAKPADLPFNDYALTWISRALMGSRHTAVLADSPAGGATILDLSDRLRTPRGHGIVDRIPAYAIRAPNLLEEPARQPVAPETIVVLQWDAVFHRLRLVEGSAVRRIRPGPRSPLAAALFSGADGDCFSAVCVNALASLHFARAPPRRAIRPFFFYDSSTAVAVIAGEVSEGALAPDGQCAAAALGNADIAAVVPARGRFSIAGRMRRRAPGTIAIAYNSQPAEILDAAAELRHWQSAPLDPGEQVIRFRHDGPSPALSLLEPAWLQQ